MSTLLQISDTHFGCEQPHVMRALEVLATSKKPDVLIVSGDITQRATRAQFANARAFCNRLGAAHLLAVPGNHDIPLLNVFARVAHPYAAYREAFGEALEQHLQTPSLCVSLVNTTRWWRHKNGQVSRAQIDRVCQQLSRATAQQLRVVVVHQPVHVLRPQDAHDILRGWKAAVCAWAEAGADMVMGGHIHLPYVHDMSTTIKEVKSRIWCVQAGTAVSSRTRREAPNSINLVEYASAGDKVQCRVERWDYLDEMTGGQFVMVQSHALNLQRK